MKKLLWHLGQEYRTILALGTAGLIIGGVVGVVAAVFGRVLDLCTGMRAEYFQPLIFCLPAAGALIVEEAGGVVTTVEGGAVTLGQKCSVLATNGRCGRLE